MKFQISNYARLGIFGLALAIAPVALPAQTQNNQPSDNNAATATTQNSDMVPGTGMTMAELRDLGYTQEQIADIRSTDLSQNAMDQNASKTANSAENPGQNPSDVQRAQSNGGGGSWGWIGLFGLFGLLGLRGGHKAATVRDDRDIRRVA